MQIRVLYFGVIRERIARTSKESISMPADATVDDLVTKLCEAHPGLRDVLRHVKVAVNEAIGGPGHVLADGDEVAIIPPVAGGADPYCRLTDQPLSVDEAVSAVTGPEQGGITIFLGVVRSRRNGKSVTRLEYEAYGSMALASLRDIVRRCEALGPDVRVAAAHRIGALCPGELAVVVAASARRRGLAFRAAQNCVELLKAETPIWKKEIGEDGAVWVEAREGLSGTGLDWSASTESVPDFGAVP
jgi:molybdopterin converting factor subunit 1